MKLQQLIKTMRLSLGKTQAQLADDLYITQHALSQYENGKRNIPNNLLEDILALTDLELTLITKKEGKHMTLSEKYPNWSIQDNGVFKIMEGRIFSDKLKQEVLVSVIQESVVVYKDIAYNGKDLHLVSKYKTTDEYLEKENLGSGDDAYLDSILEICKLSTEGAFIKTEAFDDIFTDDVLEDLAYIAENI